MGTFVTSQTTALTDLLPDGEKSTAPGVSLRPGWSYDNVLRASEVNNLANALLDVRTALRTRVDVTNYGATGDGATDDTAAIQAALDAAHAAGGGVVYFPPGTYIIAPTTTARLVLYDDLSIEGDGEASVLKVKDDAGDYATIFGAVDDSTALNNVRLRNLKIDQNATGNTTCAITTASTKAQNVLRVYLGANIQVDGVSFDPCTGVNTIVANGSTVRQVSVRGCYFRFLRGTSAAAYDNSAVYIHGNEWVVAECRFRSGAAVSEARTAIEVHGCIGAVSDNSIRDYRNGIYLVSQSSTDTLLDAHSVSCVGNVLYDVNAGIVLWALTGVTYRGVDVAGNVVYVNDADHAQATHYGIAFCRDTGGLVNGNFDAVNISDNVVVFQSEETNRYSGGDTGGLILYCQGSISNVVVANNTIKNAAAQGFRLHSSTGTASGVVVKDNTFMDAGNNSLATVRAAVVVAGTVTSSSFDGNTIIDTGSPALNGSYSWNIVAGAGSSFYFDTQTNRIFKASTSMMSAAYTAFASESSVVDNGNMAAGGTLTPRADRGARRHLIGIATAVGATTLAAPSHGVPGQRLTYHIKNTSGGAGLTITWAAAYKRSTWANPATGYGVMIEFEYDGTNWWERSKTGDVAN